MQDIGLYDMPSVNVTGKGEPERIQVLRVTDGLLPVLGVTPRMGRFFTRADDTPGSTDTVILSHAYWLDKFGGVKRRFTRVGEWNGAAIIDVREPHEYTSGHVPGATLIPVNTVYARRAELPQDKDVIFVCAIGQRSALASEMAAAAGLTRIFNLDGGTEADVKSGGVPAAQATAAMPATPDPSATPAASAPDQEKVLEIHGFSTGLGRGRELAGMDLRRRALDVLAELLSRP